MYLKEDLKILNQQLVERWIKSFDEFDQFKKHETEVVEVRYSAADAYKSNVIAMENLRLKESY